MTNFTRNISFSRSLLVSTYLGVNCAWLAINDTFAGKTASIPSITIRASSPTAISGNFPTGTKIWAEISAGSSREIIFIPAPTTSPLSTKRYSTLPSIGALSVISLLIFSMRRIWAFASATAAFAASMPECSALAWIWRFFNSLWETKFSLYKFWAFCISNCAFACFCFWADNAASARIFAAVAAANWADACVSSNFTKSCPATTSSPSFTKISSILPAYKDAISVRPISNRTLPAIMFSGSLSLSADIFWYAKNEVIAIIINRGKTNFLSFFIWLFLFSGCLKILIKLTYFI